MSCTPFPSPASLLHLCHVDTSAWSAEDAHGDHGRPSAVSISSESEDEGEGEGEGGRDNFDHGVDLPLHEGGEGDLDSVRLSCTHCRCTDVEPGTEFCPQCGTCSGIHPLPPLCQVVDSVGLWSAFLWEPREGYLGSEVHDMGSHYWRSHAMILRIQHNSLLASVYPCRSPHH
jgi:hypothetical protein